eukprot:300207-Rhodomonas_salina.1
MCLCVFDFAVQRPTSALWTASGTERAYGLWLTSGTEMVYGGARLGRHRVQVRRLCGYGTAV